MKRDVGLDVHKRTAEGCLLDHGGCIVGRAGCECTQEDILLFARNNLRKEDHLALEATTNTWAVVGLLEPFVEKIVVSNPLKTKAIAEAKIKTDKVDAYVLAQLLRTDFLPAIWIPDKKTRELRALTSRRSALTGDRTAIKCRLHSILHQRLIRPPMKELFSPSGRAWLQTVEMDTDGRAAIDSELRLLACLEKELDLLNATIARRGHQDPRLKLLLTLPGCGIAVAMTLLAAWGDISRFPSAAKAVSYLGLVPITRQSADKCYHGHITKQGNSDARWMLIQAAQHAGKDPGPLGHFYRRLHRRKGHNVAVVATARKLATIAFHMLRNNEPYRYASPRSTQTKLANLRVAVTGKRRIGGTPKGAGRPANYGTGIGTREIPSLAKLYAAEGLPSPKDPENLNPGEKKFINRIGIAAHVKSIHQTKRIVRKSATLATPDPATETNKQE